MSGLHYAYMAKRRKIRIDETIEEVVFTKYKTYSTAGKEKADVGFLLLTVLILVGTSICPCPERLRFILFFSFVRVCGGGVSSTGNVYSSSVLDDTSNADTEEGDAG
jgi:hypothetical protein